MRSKHRGSLSEKKKSLEIKLENSTQYSDQVSKYIELETGEKGRKHCYIEINLYSKYMFIAFKYLCSMYFCPIQFRSYQVSNY